MRCSNHSVRANHNSAFSTTPSYTYHISHLWKIVWDLSITLVCREYSPSLWVRTKMNIALMYYTTKSHNCTIRYETRLHTTEQWLIKNINHILYSRWETLHILPSGWAFAYCLYCEYLRNEITSNLHEYWDVKHIHTLTNTHTAQIYIRIYYIPLIKYQEGAYLSTLMLMSFTRLWRSILKLRLTETNIVYVYYWVTLCVFSFKDGWFFFTDLHM